MIALDQPSPPAYLRIASNLAMALDPVVMAERCGFIPDPWQADLLRSQSRRLLLNCSRQSGKSTNVGTLAMHTALFEEQALILLISKAQKQSIELFRKCLDIYHALDQPIKAVHKTLQALELENHSRIIALPGRDEDTIRGFSNVRLLVFEEASITSDGLYGSARPMLAVSQGRLVLLATPKGKRGFYYDAYLHRREWDYFEISADQCPRISQEFIEEERRTYGDAYVAQEYYNQFLDNVRGAFYDEDIQAAFSEEVDQWDLDR